jgi:hypothetical protein
MGSESDESPQKELNKEIGKKRKEHSWHLVTKFIAKQILPRVNTMNAKHVLSKCLSLVTPLMHKTLRTSLFAAIESSMNGGPLSITGLGSNITNKAKAKT